MPARERPDRNLAMELVRVTESAALAAAQWVGRGDKIAADGAAVDAMRNVLDTVSMDGIVVIGEGEKDEAPMLFNGERVGNGSTPNTDVAVDPIDGTTNFSRQIPHFCVSVACMELGKLKHGVIINPITQEEFIASRGRGAQLNGRKICVSNREKPEGGLFASAGSYRHDRFEGHSKTVAALVNAGGNYREPGSAALELAALAAGRIDGVWMHNLALWDIAAGCLIVQEAGGLIGDFEGGLTHLKSGNLVAANPRLFKTLGSLTRSHLT